jgi:RND family efflux transporter MFP subunit
LIGNAAWYTLFNLIPLIRRRNAMKKLTILFLGLTTGTCLFSSGRIPFAASEAVSQEKGTTPFMVSGRTKCIAGNRAIIAPTVLHPVDEIFVVVGDRVKKGDKLVQLDADEPKADVRAKVAALEAAEIVLSEANRLKESIDRILQHGVLPEQRVHEVNTAAKKAAADARQAKAQLEAAKFELEHYAVEAPIDGIVNRLDVHRGAVDRPGTTVWGEILNLSEIDVQCQLTLSQVEKLEANGKSKQLNENGMRYYGQEAEVLHNSTQEKYGTGIVVFVGLKADPTTGLVPALLRIDNGDYRLRCEVPVQVRFTATRNDKAIQEQEKRIDAREKERKEKK